MIINAAAPVKARIERDEKETQELIRYSCIVTSADDILEVKFEKMSWAEAITYKRMFEAIQKAALINKQTFTLTFGEVKPDFDSSTTIEPDDVKVKLT